MDWESQDDGFIAKLLVEDGAKDISVGTPVLVFVEEEVNLSIGTNSGQSHCCAKRACLARLCILQKV